MKLLKNIATKLGLIILGIVIGLTLAEFAVQIMYPYDRGEHIFQRHELVGWIHRPGATVTFHGMFPLARELEVTSKINSHGLNDREYPYEKPEGTFRIVILGDSFAAGLTAPLDDSFQEVLENLLNKNRERPRFEVINCGVGGYATNHELRFFLQEAYKYEPDVVLLTVLTGNDILENSRSWDPPSYTEVENVSKERNYLSLLYENFKLPHVARDAVRVFGPGWLLDLFYKGGGLLAGQSRTHKGIPLMYWVYSSPYSPEWEERVSLTVELILVLKTEVEKRNAKLGVVILTNKEQVHPEWWVEALDTFPQMRDMGWDLGKPDRILADFMDKQGISCLKLLPHFREYAAQTGKKLHYHFDGHWSVEGHRLAGRLIYNWIVESGYLP